MTLNQILENNSFSVRAYNVCGGNDLYNLDLILDYYLKNLSFKKLRNCGDGTNQELIKFCRNHVPETSQIKLPIQQLVSFLELTSTLTRKQREVINSFIVINTSSLSIRSQNAVKWHLQNNLKIKNFSRKILDANLDVNNMKNIGKKSIPEIELYIDIVKEFFDEVAKIKDDKQLTVLRNQFLIQKTFGIKQIPDEILESESIFQLTEFLFDKNGFFDNKETLILKKSLHIYENTEEITLDKIAELIGLSRERVRQLRKNCLEQFLSNFNFLKNFNDDLYSNYGIEENSSFIFVDDELKKRINKVNETIFTKSFLTFILYIYGSDEYTLIGNIEDVLQINYFNHRNRHNWHSFYLVEKQIAKSFSFERFLDDISSRYEERITETYTFNFKSYLSKFLTEDQIEMLDKIMPIAEKIIFIELNIIIDLEDNINFQRNTSKLSYEYAFEALEYLGKPSKVKNIVLAVNYLHPNYNTDEPKIRASMKRKHGFVPIGRRSIFGLKKWENELENFKGGTIRTISQEFLLAFNEPKHKKEIARYVKQFRPKTNANSIYNNLYIDESKTFVFFENYFIGLTSKEYPDKYKLLSKTAPPLKRTWDESLKDLKQFINENGRLPFSSGCPELEEKLYRWFNVQKREVKKNKLNEEQKSTIRSIAKKFEDLLGKRRTDNDKRYVKLKKFVQQHSRLPNAGLNDEKNLYSFHYKERKKYEAGELDENDKQKLIEVALLLQK
ncbi:sigma factor-like helix-turn-helix DNA-binding protein [Gillisia sp. Hel_I_29]|uniref:sigma factor-like helix-turn-helix DNA-binding protein n=1 Tax=Gillisia sp. Hel_I_29 TaxID=1249975 RepID=UPI0005581BA9|nr:sigma factor-like helix-turn-helix DNA-binding protein [Gillisia sp. Hel_I_29]